MSAWLSGLAWVAIGSGLGGAARLFVGGLVARRIGEAFPWGTIAVNVSGSLAIGVVAGLASAPGMSAGWQFGVTGFLGSYTTVSAFSLQTLMLARERRHARAGGNVLLSLGLCLAAVAGGLAIGSQLAGVSGP